MSASSGLSPGATPACGQLAHRGGRRGVQHLPGDGRELLDRNGRSTLADHTQGRGPWLSAARSQELVCELHGCLRLRSQRRARDDGGAARQPESPHRLQAPRPEHPHVLAAHRRQRRVRGVLQGRAGGRRPARRGGSRSQTQNIPFLNSLVTQLHGRQGLHRGDLLREDDAGAERPVRRPDRRHARSADGRAGAAAHLRRDERRRDRPGEVRRRLLGPGGRGRQRRGPRAGSRASS